MDQDFHKAKELVKEKLKELRAEVSARRFDHTKPAEVEINQFWFDGETIDRIMVVLRSTGCTHYQLNEGCSMCAHYDGTTETPVSADEYLAQWQSVVSGSFLEKEIGFDLNRFPVLCLYNLGSFFNPEEVPIEAVKKIFISIASLSGIKKTIIESRAEHITPEILKAVREVNPGLIEVGIGLESINDEVREICHHKNMPDLNIFPKAVETLHQYGFRALAYVNQKPPFLTEQEAIDDAINTTLFAFRQGADAVSIEPTSIQAHSLVDHLYKMGTYRVPWLWSVIEVVRGVTDKIGKCVDLRLGGYFDEEILSGSQGVAPGIERNELFPYTTSGNCGQCNDRIIGAIKEFNKNYDPSTLYKEEPCDSCFSVWKSTLQIKDSRSLPRRVFDILGDK